MAGLFVVLGILAAVFVVRYAVRSAKQSIKEHRAAKRAVRAAAKRKQLTQRAKNRATRKAARRAARRQKLKALRNHTSRVLFPQSGGSYTWWLCTCAVRYALAAYRARVVARRVQRLEVMARELWQQVQQAEQQRANQTMDKLRKDGVDFGIEIVNVA